MLDSLSKTELEALVSDYVREEVLYREAKALKLDENDFTARQRLIQQLNFINQGVLFSAIKLSDQELNQYLEQNRARYRVRPRVTFTHVYFSREKHGNEGARGLAEAKLDELQKGEVPFHEALGHGDRFLYHHNYVNKEADEIQSHFGEAMKKSLFEKIGKGRGWFGPLRSDYGFHLVLVTQHRPGHEPDLDEVRSRVEQDATRARVDEELAKVTQTIIDEYEVEVAGELQKELAPSLD